MGFLMKLFGTSMTIRFQAVDLVTGDGFIAKVPFESMGMTMEEIIPQLINMLWVEKGIRVKPGSFKILGTMSN